MIIVPSEEAENLKHAEAQATPKAVDSPTDDPPPSYTPQPPPPADEASVPAQPSLGIKPSNYISISRHNGSVKGKWVLDPTLVIPVSLLPPLAAGETEGTRKNIGLESKNGSIDADITLTRHDPNVDSKRLGRSRATISAKSYNGGISVKLHAPQSPRLPFYLNVYASNGTVHLHIPPSFHGLVTIRTFNGSSKFSASASADLTTFSDIDNIHRCFIGDYTEWTNEEQWTGDEVVVEAKNGSVKVQLDNEVSETVKAKVPGFFGRLFGF